MGSNRNGQQQAKRHVIAYINPYTIIYLHWRNPWVAAWWSASFPGLGHMLLSKYVVAFLLIFWEFGVNYFSKLNEAIYYSMVGDFGMAKSVLSKKWLLLYIAAYIFAIWDTFRQTVILNDEYKLGCLEGSQIVSADTSFLDMNKLKKRKPVYAVLWSLFAPGVGHIYIGRTLSAVLFFTWFAVAMFFSNILEAIHFTMLLDFESAKKIIDKQWFLNMPSFYVFSAYDAYVNAVEYNRLFEKEQAQHFKRHYQSPEFVMPV